MTSISKDNINVVHTLTSFSLFLIELCDCIRCLFFISANSFLLLVSLTERKKINNRKKRKKKRYVRKNSLVVGEGWTSKLSCHIFNNFLISTIEEHNSTEWMKIRIYNIEINMCVCVKRKWKWTPFVKTKSTPTYIHIGLFMRGVGQVSETFNV